MSNRHFKSGMGTDVDPVRMLLVVLVLILNLKAFESHNAALLVLGVVAAVAAGWWVTRAWYLDRIEGLEAQLAAFEEEHAGAVSS